MKRAKTLMALVLGLSLAPYATALASIDSLTADGKATLADSAVSAALTGTIVCTIGDEVNINAVIVQDSGKIMAGAVGDATITCSGQLQHWALTANLLIGSKLKHGPSTVILNASDVSDATSFPTQVQRLKL